AERAFGAALERIQQLVEWCPNERHLVHSDLLNFNVLVHDERVAGVIDWGSALYGDFVWDIAWLTFWQPWYPAWRDVDIADAARRHYAQIGLEVPLFDDRLHCYELCIALDGMKYQAFTNRPRDLEATGHRTLELLR